MICKILESSQRHSCSDLAKTWEDLLDFILLVALLTLFLRSHVSRYLRFHILFLGLGLYVQNAFGSNIGSLTWLSSVIKLIPLSCLLDNIIGVWILVSLANFLLACRFLTRKSIINTIAMKAISIGNNIPAISKQISSEKLKIQHEIESSLKKCAGTEFKTLPTVGLSGNDILTICKNYQKEESKVWQNGKVSGAVYYGNEQHTDILNQVYNCYSLTNPLHSDLWPSLMKFESEIVSMTSDLLNGGDPGVVGSVTSGGTESIILAVKAYRDYYRTKRGILHPEILACDSAHAAIDKACDMLGIKLIRLPMDPNSYKLIPSDVRRAISSRTIMIYSSAPTFGQGVIDPISTLGRIAVRFDVGLHVDCCLGGFILPFAVKLGYNLPEFDFAVNGVTSISSDTHKFGYSLKGTSVLLFRNAELRKFQYFMAPDWSGGIYATPTIGGSRSGGNIAACWASLVHLGEAGYLRETRRIMEAVTLIATAVQEMTDIQLMGDAQAMIVCFGSSSLNVLRVGDVMSRRFGWSLNLLQFPASVHVCVTVKVAENVVSFVEDLKSSVEFVKQNPNDSAGGLAAVYGVAATMPAGPVGDMLCTYMDYTLKA